MSYIPFFKMSGNGNDFVILDSLKLNLIQIDLSFFIKKICNRRMSIGADGFIVISKSEISDFKCQFFNSDGSSADMCGNGARCIAKYAYINGIADKKMTFETNVAILTAEVIDDFVKVKMPDPKGIKLLNYTESKNPNFVLNCINIGIPHAVVFINHIDTFDVFKIGKNICNHIMFKPECINVNFVEILQNNTIFIRTYERGIEHETLSCGTGSVAVAIICAIKYNFESPIVLNNNLKVYFKRNKNIFSNVFLKGDARVVYTGLLWEEGWKYFQK